MRTPDRFGMRPIEELAAHSCVDCRNVASLGREVISYLREFDWCEDVKLVLYDHGLVFASVFLVEICPLHGADEVLWVVSGDIPPLYLDCGPAPDGATALTLYLELLESWLDAYRKGRSLEDEMPICYRNSRREIAPSDELFEILTGRARFLRDKFLNSNVLCD